MKLLLHICCGPCALHPIRELLDKKSDKIGLDTEDVTAAQFRWALFEEWVKSQRKYKGWESDPALFKKANEEFRNRINPTVRVLK